MKYLLIRNNGIAPIEAFTILGLSTARGEADKIGQFGSGSKHGILTLMRAKITPRIFLGEDELAFTTHPAKMGDKDYQEVRYTFQNQEHKTGMCLDFGSLDWDAVTMALREFICNALDQGEAIHECAWGTDQIQPHPEETRVYVPMEEQVADYFQRLRDFFLHFDRLESTPIIPARTNAAQFYRRGVFVTERGALNKGPALFAYNFQDGRIDESRNLDGAAVGQIAAKLLHKSPEHLETVFRSFIGDPKWEHEIGGSVWSFEEGPKAVIRQAWRAAHGDLPFARNIQVSEQLARKGIQHVRIPVGYGSCLEYAGLKDGAELLNDLDQLMADEVDATESCVETFRRAWRWIEAARLTNGKTFPKVKCFSLTMNQGEEKVGYYRDGIVFLNLDYDTNEQAALEELAHYITGAKDETRDFQDFAFKMATRLAKTKSA